MTRFTTIVLGLSLISLGQTLLAQTYPTKPIRLIVPYPPGGGNDTLARLFGAKLTEAWGQQVVVDNRPGAGTIKGGGPAHAGLIGGETTMMFDTAASILPYVRSGRLKALAIARAARLPEYPNLPTFTEAGLPGYEVNAWYSMHAPAGVARAVIEKWHGELTRVLKLPDIQERLKVLGSEGIGNSPEEFARFVRAESAKYAKAIRDAGIKVE